jgi:hypothetical protein
MVARIRKTKALVTRMAVLAVAAAAFVVISGLPAQAQVFYAYPPYAPSCQTFSFGVVGYTTCNPPATYYYPAPTYYAPPAPYYNHPYNGPGRRDPDHR